jgi:hypothetical protein
VREAFSQSLPAQQLGKDEESAPCAVKIEELVYSLIGPNEDLVVVYQNLQAGSLYSVEVLRLVSAIKCITYSCLPSENPN